MPMLQVIDYMRKLGGRTRARTWDPLIKSSLLSSVFKRLRASNCGVCGDLPTFAAREAGRYLLRWDQLAAFRTAFPQIVLPSGTDSLVITIDGRVTLESFGEDEYATRNDQHPVALGDIERLAAFAMKHGVPR